MLMICPCKGCDPPERMIGCHGTCERYSAWQREYKEVKKKEKTYKANAQLMTMYTKHAIRNMKTRKRG